MLTSLLFAVWPRPRCMPKPAYDAWLRYAPLEGAALQHTAPGGPRPACRSLG